MDTANDRRMTSTCGSVSARPCRRWRQVPRQGCVSAGWWALGGRWRNPIGSEEPKNTQGARARWSYERRGSPFPFGSSRSHSPSPAFNRFASSGFLKDACGRGSSLYGWHSPVVGSFYGRRDNQSNAVPSQSVDLVRLESPSSSPRCPRVGCGAEKPKTSSSVPMTSPGGRRTGQVLADPGERRGEVTACARGGC